MQPAFSDAAPQRLNLGYAESDGKAYWLADPVPRLPQSLRAAAAFSQMPTRVLQLAYVAPAGAAKFAPPKAQVTRNGEVVNLVLESDGEGVNLIVPAQAKVRAVTLAGITTNLPDGPVSISCGTPDCTKANIGLKLASKDGFQITLVAYARGLPPEGAKLLQARPSWSVPSRRGDVTAMAQKIAVPQAEGR